MRIRSGLVAPLLFGSGFCALIYQTSWLREFRLVFGVSTAATAAVLGVFMAGLGFGGIILGRLTEKKERPLAFYAQLELLIGATAALSPLLILAARYLYIAIGGTEALGITMGTGVRLIVAALIIGPPTFLMGGTLPAAARAVVKSDDVMRRSVGLLYGTNTLGAVAGALVGTFYCFENFGNRLTLWLAAALNILIAVVALRISKSTIGTASDGSSQPTQADTIPRANSKLVLSAAAIVGFAFFLMEMVWYRMLGPLLGGSTFSFGLILAVALLGISVGGAAYAFIHLRQSASLRLFALTCAAEAFCIALPYAFGDRVAMVAMLLRPLGTLGFAGHVVAWAELCFIVVFPAAFFAGLQFPLLIALLGSGKNIVGSHTGMAYAWNTTGALLGSLAGGFLLMPLVSAPGVWKIVVVLLCAVALLAVLCAWREPQPLVRSIAPIVIIALALLMLTATGPTAFWRHSQIGVGRLRQYEASRNERRDLVQTARRQTFWDTDGIESSVALENSDGLAYIVNGRSDGNAKIDAGTQIMSGLIGAALHPLPLRALVIGLGSGSTGGWLAAVPSIERVDLIELEPAMLKVAEKCAPVNRDALQNPKLHIVIGDARERLLTTRQKYDLIVSEPSHPYRAGVAGLFTREFYQSVEQRLEQDGIFCQWVQAFEVDDRTIQIIYRTLSSVFPNIETWQTEDRDLLLVATRKPIQYKFDALRSRLSEEPFKDALLYTWAAEGVEDFLAHYLGNESIADSLRDMGSTLNTDNRTVIEFGLARTIGLSNGFQIAGLRAAAQRAHADRPLFVTGEIDWSRVDEARFSMHSSLYLAPEMQAALSPEQKQRVIAFLDHTDGNLFGAWQEWRGQSSEPKTLSQLIMVAECLAVEGDNAAVPYVEKLAAIRPLDAEAIRARLFWKQGKPTDAAQSLTRFFYALRSDPWANYGLARRSIALAAEIAQADESRVVSAQLYDTLRLPFSAFNHETERLVTLLNIGLRTDGINPGEYTLQAVEAFEPNVPWQHNFLHVREACYSAMHSGRAAQAKRDFDRFINDEPLGVEALTREIEKRSKENKAGRNAD